MKIYTGGVRGGQVMTDAACAGYGGDTTCFLIEGESGERLIIDAGTGLRHVQARLLGHPPPTKTALFLFSHFHLDHLVGLPAFKLLLDKDWTFEFASQVIGESTVEEVLDSFFRPPVWPLTWDEMDANKRFRILDAESMETPSQYGELAIRWCPLDHPGGSTAFRVDDPARAASVVVATDVEWSSADPENRAAFLRLCTRPTPAHTLIMDGQYTAEEYQTRRGWGHSSWEEVVAVAKETGIQRLYITHLDPGLTDTAARDRELAIQKMWPAAALARQGEVLHPGAPHKDSPQNP